MLLFKPLLLVAGWVMLLVSTPAWSVDQPVKRLITAGGTLTDIVFAVGGESRVIGVDTSSTSPAAVKALPQVGYYRNLSAEGVLSFTPDTLWVLEGGGSERALQQIEQTGVSVQRFDKPTTLSELYHLIHNIASRLGTDDRAEAVVQHIKQAFQPVHRDRPLSGLLVLQVSGRGVVAAGQNTVVDLLFQHSDIHNVFQHDGFKTVSREFLLASAPDFIVAPSHVVQAHGGREAFCQQSALQLLEAGRNCRSAVMDSLLILGMTTRIAEAQHRLLEFVDDL